MIFAKHDDRDLTYSGETPLVIGVLSDHLSPPHHHQAGLGGVQLKPHADLPLPPTMAPVIKAVQVYGDVILDTLFRMTWN